MSKVLCIYHSNCADGLGAAWAVHRTLGDEVEFVAAKYGEDPPYMRKIGVDSNGKIAWYYRYESRNRDILIVDFSYPLEVLRAMASEARSVLVLDHHKTAQEDLLELPSIPEVTGTVRRWLTYEETFPTRTSYNLAAIFDLDRSGAGLAWDYLHPDKPRPRIIDLIEDRDLWRFKFGDESRAFHAVLASYDWSDLPWMFNWLNGLDESQGMYLSEVLGQGHAILRANARTVTSTVAASRRTIKIAGHVVPCANVPPSMASDAGHLLCQKHYSGDVSGTYEACVGVTPAFSATYYDGADGKRHFSLRSPEDGADVGAIAKWIMANHPKDPEGKWLGCSGGGHPHAAGFDAPLGWEGE